MLAAVGLEAGGVTIPLLRLSLSAAQSAGDESDTESLGRISSGGGGAVVASARASLARS